MLSLFVLVLLFLPPSPEVCVCSVSLSVRGVVNMRTQFESWLSEGRVSGHGCFNVERGRIVMGPLRFLGSWWGQNKSRRSRILRISKALRLFLLPCSARHSRMFTDSCRYEHWSEKTGALCLSLTTRNTNYFHLVVAYCSRLVARKYTGDYASQRPFVSNWLCLCCPLFRMGSPETTGCAYK